MFHGFVLGNEYPLFYPVYTLHRKNHSSSGSPRWEPKSAVGIYCGHSPEHAGDVALVMNLQTGHVTPQFHVVFDDGWTAVPYLNKLEAPPNWKNLFQHHTEHYNAADFEAVTASEHDKKSPPLLSSPHMVDNSIPVAVIDPRVKDFLHGDVLGTDVDQSLCPPSDSIITVPEGELSQENIPSSKGEYRVSNTLSSEEETRAAEEPILNNSPPATPPPEQTDTSISSRGRVRKASNKLLDNQSKSGLRLKQALGFLGALASHSLYAPHFAYATYKRYQFDKRVSFHAKTLHHLEVINMNSDSTYSYIHPLSFAASKGDNETYYFLQAMQQDDREDFIDAMIKEIDDHTSRDHWKVVKRSMIGDAKTIKAIWSFKRKRRPDGSLLKHKARLCAHGGMQEYGENYWDTYAPVVNWASVRLMMTFAMINKMHFRSIDFTLAFPQADTDVDIFMELPIGVDVPNGEIRKDYVLYLLKNLYGLKQASKTYFEYLCSHLEAEPIGMESSRIDPCIWYKEGVILIIYVDDCLIFSKNKELADELIQQLRVNFTLTDEGSVESYLGVQVEFDKDKKTISLKQPYLIKRIISALKCTEHMTGKETPVLANNILHKDSDGPERKQSWNYRSLIGILNFLSASTRPDILFAVHQCARFLTCPKLIHEQAVKRIVRYLVKTRDKGIEAKIDESKGIECHVDADFCGNYHKYRSDDPTTLLSRTGFIIFYMNCPIVCVSKLQGFISLSTTEAEYIALSHAMRELIPFSGLVQELNEIFLKDQLKPIVKCKLFEDNNGALELTRISKYRLRTKHIALQYHHFRNFVKEGKVEILPIDSKEQIADIFAKGISDVALFKHLRHKLLGWIYDTR